MKRLHKDTRRGLYRSRNGVIFGQGDSSGFAFCNGPVADRGNIYPGSPADETRTGHSD